MNENLNLCKILRDCPRGMKLWSPFLGEVEFIRVKNDIIYVDRFGEEFSFFSSGRFSRDGECELFPSKDQRDWSKFNISRKRFDPETFKPFDKVLIRLHFKYERWECNFFSNWLGNGEAICLGKTAYECIPYNDETKHLVGTQEDCPDYYKWWEK